MLFVDSSDPKEVRDLFAWGAFAGVTTNPLILSREAPGADLESLIAQVCAASHGPVSVEVLADTEAEMFEEAARYHAWQPERICVKVPFSEAGLRVVHRLTALGIPTNATCIMSFNQAYLAALAGATYVSIFVGRVRDMGYDAGAIIRELRAVFEREKLAARILVGSVRQMIDVNDAIRDGAHVVTVPPPILRKMLWNPRTESTIQEFSEAWKKQRS